MRTAPKRRIVVLGSYGEFTRRVVTGLVALPQVECVLGLAPAARATSFAAQLGVPFMVLDPNDPSSLKRLLDGTFAVVNLRGPFVTREHLAVAARCAAQGVHYIDPADSREYVNEFMRLGREAREHDVLLVTGAGTAPAMTAALVGVLTAEFDRVSEIHLFLTPGMGDQRELATARAILDHSADSVRVRERGRWREEHWWKHPESIRFPKPVGRRRGWFCNLPDLDLLVRHFGAGTVTARAGFAPGFLSALIALLAKVRQHGSVDRLTPLIGWSVRLAARLARSDGTAAALRVAVCGTRRNVAEEHVISLVAREGAGPAIAAAPILALVRQWVEQGVQESGAVPCVGMLSFDDLRPALAEHDIVLVRE